MLHCVTLLGGFGAAGVPFLAAALVSKGRRRFTAAFVFKGSPALRGGSPTRVCESDACRW